MKSQFEKNLLLMILRDTRKIFKDENSITKNYRDCYNYLNLIIVTVADNASDWLLNELYSQRLYYQYKYLFNKGLI